GAAQRLLDEAAQAVETSANMPLIGYFRSLSGRLKGQADNYEEAQHLLGQAVAIYEMIADQYREAATHYHLGKVWADASDPARAREEWEKAREIVERLGAQPMLARLEAALSSLNVSATSERKLSTATRAVMPAITELSSAAVL